MPVMCRVLDGQTPAWAGWAGALLVMPQPAPFPRKNPSVQEGKGVPFSVGGSSRNLLKYGGKRVDMS